MRKELKEELFGKACSFENCARNDYCGHCASAHIVGSCEYYLLRHGYIKEYEQYYGKLKGGGHE